MTVPEAEEATSTSAIEFGFEMAADPAFAGAREVTPVFLFDLALPTSAGWNPRSRRVGLLSAILGVREGQGTGASLSSWLLDLTCDWPIHH